MSKLFKLSQCYSEITPESAELGDFDDHGFEIESNNDYSLSEALDLIRRCGFEYMELQGNRFFVSSGYNIVCYREMREKQLDTFLEFKTDKQAKKIFNIFKKVLKF